MHTILCLIFSFLLFSCSSEKPRATARESASGTVSSSGPSGGTYTLEITPSDPTRNATLNLVSGGGGLSTARIVWLVNGAPADSPAQNQFPANETTRGDRVQAKAVFQNNHEVSSNMVTIMNAPPEITSLKLLPEVFKPGDTLSVEAEGKDIDGDAVSFLYEWTRNGEPAGKGKSMDVSVHGGDKVAVQITPYDGETYGSPAVLRREIRNFPPMVVNHNEFTFDGNVYAYQVKATDPDGDTLTYSLETPPSGMTIDPATGFLRWNVPPEFKGNKDVSIIVSDGHGGTATYGITITIR